MNMIPVYKPYVAPNTKSYLSSVVDANWYSSGGYYYEAAKNKLQELLNVKHILLTNNGTSATHLLAKILTYKKPIKKIICQNGAYVAAWNSFLFDNKYSLEVCDLNLETWNYDREELNKVLANENPENVALLVVHNIGNPFEYNDKRFLVVEDNCEGFLGTYNVNKKTGTNCLASSVSFFANKNITCGEGGAVVTNDDDSYEFINTVHGQGQSAKRFIHSHLGYNYRMTNVAAAILLSQLEVVDEILDKKQQLFNFYRKELNDIESVSVQRVENTCEHSNWMFGIRIQNSEYDKAQHYFNQNGIEIRPMFYPMSDQPYIKSFIESNVVNIRSEKNAKLLNKEAIVIPSFPDITTSERNHVINVIKNYVSLL